MTAAPSFYDDDLAWVHHRGFSDFIEQAGPEILKILAAAGIHEGLVIDLGCGSGTWARQLTDRGFNVLGIDVSEAMIRLSREIAPAAQFHCGSIYDLPLQPCVAVTALGEPLNYGVGELPSDELLSAFFRRVAESLVPGGLFIFDVVVQGEGPPMGYRAWRKGDDWAVLFEVGENPERQTLTREITIFRETDRGYRRSEEEHEIRVYSPERLVELLTQCDFTVGAGTSYGNYNLAPRRRSLLARKKLL